MGRSGVLQRDYEVTFVLNATIDEEASAAAVERVNTLIAAGGGSVTEVHAWGRRRLAYPIEHQRDGVYITTRFAMPTLALTAFENDLKLNEAILRHLVVRQDEVPLRPILPVPAAAAHAPAPTTAQAEPELEDAEDADLLEDAFDPDLVPAADE
jgi:small subunit ribosomal protein S6